MAHDVFISYAEEDRRVADAVCQALEGAGVRCWYAPRNIPYGVDYEEAIVDAISASKLLVLILSSNSNNSAHVKREVQNAYREESQVSVLPFQVEEVKLNKALKYYIGSAQWLKAITPPLEPRVQRLVEHVQGRLTGREQGSAARAQSSPPAQGTLGGMNKRGPRDLAIVVVSLIVIAAIIYSARRTPESKRQPAGQSAAQTGGGKTEQGAGTFPATAAENALRGKELFYQKRYADAEPYYREAMRLEPNNPQHVNNLGTTLNGQRKYADAEPLFREAIRLNPQAAIYYNNLGNNFFDQGRYADAEAQYRKAVSLDPGNAAFNNNLGNALYSQQRFIEAKAYYLKAVTLDPNNPTYQQNLNLVSGDDDPEPVITPQH